MARSSCSPKGARSQLSPQWPNGIQLARCAGYRVITTASPRNFGYVRSLGAVAAVDYHSRTAVDEIIKALGDSPPAGTLAIGSGSLQAALSIASKVPGRRRAASAQPQLVTRIQTAFRPHKGIHVSGRLAQGFRSRPRAA